MGNTVGECWDEIPKHFANVSLDALVIMPNHVHGVLMFGDLEKPGWEIPNPKLFSGRDVQLNVPTMDIHKSISPKRGTLSVVVRTFKAAVTTRCRREGIKEFRWQSRFYDRIIRDDDELNRVREYITANQAQWAEDKENPQRTGPWREWEP
jgi:REP element-mobilizing transposase RayT